MITLSLFLFLCESLCHSVCMHQVRLLEDITRRKALPITNHVETLISDFQPLELWEISFLSFKPSSLWYFIAAAQMNWDVYDGRIQLTEDLVPDFTD